MCGVGEPPCPRWAWRRRFRVSHRQRQRASVSGRLRQEGDEDSVELREEPRDECGLEAAMLSSPGRAASPAVAINAQRVQPRAPTPAMGRVTDPAAARPGLGGVTVVSDRSLHGCNPVLRFVLTVATWTLFHCRFLGEPDRRSRGGNQPVKLSGA